MTAYPTVFDLIADLAQKAGVRLILIGGFAVNAYGVARTTQDVDFLIRDEEYSAFHEAFEKQGFHEVFRNKLFARFEHSTRSEMPVDILFLDDATFDSVWKGGKTVSLHGCSFATPSLDHLIALKLHAVKQGGERREWKDLDDILNLVSENKFDDAKLKKLCLKFGPPGVYEMLLKKNKKGSYG